jgi:hypothetical protein
MRKTILLAVLPLLLLACGGDKAKAGEEAGTAVPTAQAANAVPQGSPYDCSYFSLTLAEGWAAGPPSFGMVNVLPKGKVSPGLYFKFEGDCNAAGSAEASIESMIKNYGGAPMTESTIAGTVFKTTTYSYSGMTQTMHVAFRNGTKITITVEGAGAADNPDIRAMLGTLVLK